MKSKKSKRILAAILCMVMVLTNAFSILAEETEILNAETVTEEAQAADTEVSHTEETAQSETPEQTEETPETEVTPEESQESPETEVTPEEPQPEVSEKTKELKYEDDQIIVSVTAVEEGAIPEGAALKVVPIILENNETKVQYEDIEKKIQEKAAEEEQEVTGFLAYDITLADAEGNELEPNGKVKVSMNYKNPELPEKVKQTGRENTEIAVFHLEEDENGNVKDVVDMSEKEAAKVETLVTAEGPIVKNMEVETDSFSAFVITWVNSGNTELKITAHYGYVDEQGDWQSLEDKDYTLKSADQKIDLTDKEYQLEFQGYTYQTTTIDTYTGTAVSELCSEPSDPSSDKQYCIDYKKVDGNEYEEWLRTDDKDKLTGDIYFVYTKNQGKAEIKNDILNSGSLIAEVTDTGEAIIQKYTWFKSDSETGDYSRVRKVNYENGKSNLSENGDCLYAAYDDGARMWYKVEVKLSDGTTIVSEPYRVPYYNQLQNGGFETPDAGRYPSGVLRATAQYSNEEFAATEGAVWQTTGEGSGHNGQGQNMEGHDIELVQENGVDGEGAYSWHSGGLSDRKWADAAIEGKQFAELNCEAAGALYQDVLTIEGEGLNYWLSHRARGKNTNPQDYEKDTMFLVIMPTKLAIENNLTTQENLEAYVQNTLKIPGREDEAENAAKQGYKIYSREVDGENVLVVRITSNDHKWQTIKELGGYTPSESLTRFFFMSGQTASNDPTVGNFIDNVGFTQALPETDPGKFTMQINKKFEGLDKEKVEEVRKNLQFQISATDKSGKALTEKEIKSLFGTTTISGKDMTLKGENTLTYSLENKAIGKNAPYKVTITEKNETLKGYDLTSSWRTTVSIDGETEKPVKGSGTEAAIKKLSGGTTALVEFTNSYQGTSITVEKVWNDGEIETRPESISFNLLYREKGSADDWKVYEKYDITADDLGTDNEPWTKIIEGLPKTNEYKIEELGLEKTPGYISDIDGFTIKNTLIWKIKKLASEDQTPLKGAKFELKDIDNNVVATGISKEDGMVSWEPAEGKDLNYLNGTYRLHETQAPQGYVVSEKDWTLTFADGLLTHLDDKEVKGTATEGVIVEITNTRVYELPSTGGSGIFVYTISGTLLLIAATLLLYKMKREGALKN